MTAFSSIVVRTRMPGPVHVHAGGAQATAGYFDWAGEHEMKLARFNGTRVLAHVVLYPAACVALTTALLELAHEYAALEFQLTAYLIPVVICAVQWGRAAAFAAIFATAAVADFLFIPPVYSFAISDPRQIIELTLFVFVALVTSHLAGRLKAHVEALQQRKLEIDNLYELTRRIALGTTARDLHKAIQVYLSAHLGCQVHLVHLAVSYGDEEDDGVPPIVVQEASNLVIAREPGLRLVTEPEKASLWALRYMATTVGGYGVLAVNLGRQAGSDASGLDERIDALFSAAHATLARIDAVAALTKANMRLASETLKTALIDVASHELRSPLAAILGSASVLDQLPAVRDNEKMRSLVDGMHEEAERLDSDIQNLLGMARIADSGITPHMTPTDLADILGTAVRRCERRISAHNVTVDVAPNLPLVNVDPVLLERAIGQLIENAAKYSPAGSDIAVAACTEDGQVVLSVADKGAGLTGEEAARIFERAYRGPRHLGNVPGLGLGLWIARTFVTVNGGTLSAQSEGPGRGTTMSIRLPVPPPEASPSADVQAC